MNLYCVEFRDGTVRERWSVRADGIDGAITEFRARYPGALIVHVWKAMYE